MFTAKAGPSIRKSGARGGGTCELLSRAFQKTHGVRASAWPRSVSSRAHLPSDGQAEGAMQQRAKHAAGTSALHGASLGKVADAIVSMSSAQGDDPKRIAL